MEEITCAEVEKIKTAIRDKVSLLKRKHQDYDDYNKEKYKSITRSIESLPLKLDTNNKDNTHPSLKGSEPFPSKRPFLLPLPTFKSKSVIPIPVDPHLQEIKEEAWGNLSPEAFSPTASQKETSASCHTTPQPSGRVDLGFEGQVIQGRHHTSDSAPAKDVSFLLNQEMFESSDSPIKMVSEAAATPEGEVIVEQFLNKVGKVSSEYVKLFTDNRTHDLDEIYGVRFDGDHFYVGDSIITINDDFVEIDDTSFKVTPGLAELLFKKKPLENRITSNDYDHYKQILEMTNAHKRRYSASEPINIQMSDPKYKRIISKLVKRKSKSGRGNMHNPNRVVEHLKYLLESKGNEEDINAIEQVLRRGGIIR